MAPPLSLPGSHFVSENQVLCLKQIMDIENSLSREWAWKWIKDEMENEVTRDEVWGLVKQSDGSPEELAQSGSRESRRRERNWQSSCSGMAPHSSTLAWKIPWTEEPGRLQSMWSRRLGHDWATSLSLFTFMHWRRKWQSTPVFLPGESQGRRSLVGCHLWGRAESDTTEAT